jgi:hypothetical protein
MISTKDLYWLAGLFEGEGCFTAKRENGGGYPYIFCGMTDRDVIERIHKLIPSTVIEIKSKKLGYKPIWRWAIWGGKAAGVMMTLYPLMGERRKAKIKELLEKWKKTKRRPFSRIALGYCKHGHTLSDNNIRRTTQYDGPGKIRELRVCLICHKERVKKYNHSQYMKRKKADDLQAQKIKQGLIPASL